MKRGYKKLLSVLGAFSLAMPFTGCETDAQEAADTATSAPAASASATLSTVADGTNKSAAAAATLTTTTNATTATVTAGGTNTVVNQQTTIINRIPPTLPADVKLSKGVEEVVKLLHSGVSETVVLLFVEKSTDSFELDAADIVYLNDVGVSSTVLAAMLNHDGQNEDVLHNALSTNSVATVTAPPPQTTAQAAPQVEVSSNYVAAPQYGGTVVAQDPNATAQQAVEVQQQPVYVQQPVVVTQPAVTYSYFYSSLSPYGSWVEVPDYGWCWQPTIAVTHRSWRPYVHGGRWLNSDAGWYWQSDYSWGWAPFHYGRWHCSPRAGWVWMPDYTWGPSWVTWRRSGEYCGWAPLPPRCGVRPGIGFSYWGRDVGFNFSFGYSHDYYTFVPTRRFCDRRVIDHVVPTERTVNMYRDSTVVNNYIVGNNNTIVNNGIGRDYVASHTRNEIPRVRVQDTPRNAGRTVAPDRVQKQGSELVVYRPPTPAPSLVAAHESAMARSRAETGRPAGVVNEASSGTRGNLVPARSGRTEAQASTTTVNSGGARNGAVPITRNESARPQAGSTQFASRGSEIPVRPVFGTPAPVRPEPDRSAEIVRSRSAVEAGVRRPVTAAGNNSVGGGGLVSTTPTVRPDAIRPSAPNRNIAPRFTPNQPNQITRDETPRGNAQAPSVVGRNETARPTVTLPSGRSVTANTPATSPSFARPTTANTARQEPARSPDLAAPQVSRPNVTASQPPASRRPAPSAAQAPQPIARNAPATPTSSSAAPTWSRQAAVQQGTVTTSPQPIQRAVPSVQAPAPVARSESFSRPSAPPQRAPAPTVVQPRSVSPVQPSYREPPVIRPQMNNPSAQVARPAPNVSVSHAPVNGGNFRSAPPAPAARPSAQPSGSSGRDRNGRLEIGR